MQTSDLVLRAVAPATLAYVPVLVDVLEATDQPAYELADQVQAQAWLLQSLETRLADYAMVWGTTPALLNALGAVGDLVKRLIDLRAQLVVADHPGILSGIQAHLIEDLTTERECAAALAELMPDEAGVRITC